MDSTQESLIKIAKVSQELCKTLTDAKARSGGLNRHDISRAQFWLDKIKVTSGEILKRLNQCTITGCNSTLDEQLECWISANGPVICLMTLDEVKRTIGTNWREKTFFNSMIPELKWMSFNPTQEDDKIREAIRILHDRRNYFDYLLASGVWNKEMYELHQLAASPPVLQVDVSMSPSVGMDTQDGEQERMNARNAMTGEKCHDNYSSFNPSQETMIEGLGEENFDCSGTTNLKTPCYDPKTGPLCIIPSKFGRNRQVTWSSEHQSTTNLAAMMLKGETVQTDIEKEVPNDWVNLGEKLDLILQWLNAFKCFEKHRAALSQRQVGTCTWLPATNEYKTWLTGENSFLWLHGKPGCGKSVLIAYVIEHLEETFKDSPPAFFYCDFGKERSMDATEVLCSLLYQLVDQYRCGEVELGAFQVIDKLLEEGHKGDAALKDTTYLSSLLSRVVRQFRQPPLIVIDALDECRDVDCLLAALLRLKAEKVRLFVSSRSIPRIKHRFSGLPHLSVDKMAEAVSADIELHVSKEIDSDIRLGFLDEELKEKLHSTLCQKADGMFRWVQCQLDALKRCFTRQAFNEALDNLPTGLYATYEKILLGIDQRLPEGKVARRALLWLVTTSRPLILGEIFEALSIDLQKQTLDRSKAPIHKYALLDVLGSLVMHDEKTGIISLSHFSVKEYLINDTTRKKMPFYYINLRGAHKQIFQMCMCYLVTSLNRPFEDDETILSRPLLDYTFSRGFDHLMHLDPMDDAILYSMTIVQSEIQKHPLQWTRMCSMASSYPSYSSWITDAHDFIVCVLISMFPEPFLCAFLRHAPRPRGMKHGSNPLVHALQFDKVEHARTLLSYGVSVNNVGWDVDALDFKSPLEVALERQNSTFVDLFLKEGSAAISREIYSTIFDGHHCAYLPHFVSSLLQADEFVEWATEVEDTDFLLRPLNRNRYGQHQVTERDLLVMMRRLVQVGRDIFPIDSSKQILLMVALAASGEHLSLLEYLLSIDAPMPSGIALAKETSPLIRNIARQGHNVEAIAAKGDTVLHHVLGPCPGGSRCWVFDCNLCSAFRSVLLTVLGRDSERTLTKISTISRELIATFVDSGTGKISNPGIVYALPLLEKIVLASGGFLQAIHKSILDDSIIDCRLKRWLSEKEPNICLEILQQMMELVTPEDSKTTINLEEGGHYEVPNPLFPEDKINDAIALFSARQTHFHFLLSIDIEQVSNISESASGSLSRKNESDSRQPFHPDSTTIPAINQGTISNKPKPSISRAALKEVDIIFVGQTGVGKSSLINMLMGIADHSDVAAELSNDARPCTTHTASYAVSFPTGLHCRLWDTRGFDEVADTHGFKAWIVDKIRQLASQQASELKAVLRSRIKQAIPLLFWCLDASRIDVEVHWHQLRKVYVDYCDRKAVLAVVITRGHSKTASDWERRCKAQLQSLDLGVEVPLLMVWRYRGPSCPQYAEDAKALRDFVSQLVRSMTFGHDGSSPL